VKLATLETPCLLLDPEVMRRNIARLSVRLRNARVPLRPHVKTTKCVEIARLMTSGQPGGIAVSTLLEAERFAAAGFSDILYAVAISPNKIERALAVARSGVRLTLILDNVVTARNVCAVASRHNMTCPILMELDIDGHRSGIPADLSEVIPLASELHTLPGIALRGILTHAGSAYDSAGIDTIAAVAERERACMLNIAGSLRDRGLPCDMVSVGSTPTALFAPSYEGMTEIRAGVFAFNDLMQEQLGVCGLRDIAVTVLCTVIGHHEKAGRLIVDAGWTALSHETLVQEGSLVGLVSTVDAVPIQDLALTGVNQEHGIVTRPSGRRIDFAEFPVGRMLRVFPVHACATAAAHDRYHVIGTNGEVVDIWERFGGWRPSTPLT
jgi:D-serine deaminase-like pyridoxal phosphate-dependent protein